MEKQNHQTLWRKLVAAVKVKSDSQECKESKEREKIKILEQDISFQQDAARKNCRRIIYALLVASWGYLFREDTAIGKLALSPIFLIGVGYLMVETWCYFSIARKGRELYALKDSLTDEAIETEMSIQSYKSFSVLYGQLFMCLIMGAALAAYVAIKYL